MNLPHSVRTVWDDIFLNWLLLSFPASSVLDQCPVMTFLFLCVLVLFVLSLLAFSIHYFFVFHSSFRSLLGYVVWFFLFCFVFYLFSRLPDPLNEGELQLSNFFN